MALIKSATVVLMTAFISLSFLVEMAWEGRLGLKLRFYLAEKEFSSSVKMTWEARL